MTLATSVLTDPHEIAALIPEWDALTQTDLRATPYQTGSVTIGIGGLWADVGTPYIVVARAFNDKLVAVLPLRRIPGGGRLGGHGLIPYPEWHVSYFDSIVDAAFPDAGEALQAALRVRRDWDRCDFRYLRPGAHLLHTESTAHASSDGSFQWIDREAYAGYVSSGGAKPHKAERRLSKAGAVVFTAAEPPDQVEHALRRFGAMHTSRWTDFGDAAEFADPVVVNRLIRLTSGVADSAPCRIGTLRLSGEIIAVHIAYRWRDAQFSWRLAHDARWQEMSPGRLLMSLMIEEAFAAGCSRCDLGRGEGGYKRRWPTEERPLVRLTARGQTWRGRFAALRERR